MNSGKSERLEFVTTETHNWQSSRYHPANSEAFSLGNGSWDVEVGK
jgi:hypothetical protein